MLDQILDRGPAGHLAYDLEPGAAGQPTLVYCHGLLAHRQGTRVDLIRRFCVERRWTLLRFDFQGRGDSSGTLTDLTLTRQIDDLAAIFRVLPDGCRPLLLGSSYGGLTSAWFAGLHPERVAGCVLIAPAFGFVPGLLRRVGLAVAQRWRRDGVHRFEPPIDLPVHYELVRDGGGYPDELLAQHLTVPTLIYHGTEDDAVPVERSLAFARGATGPVDLRVFQGADHLLHPQMPEILALTEVWAQRFAGAEEPTT